MTIAALGLFAGALTTCAWLPQLLRTWHRQAADDISWPYLVTFGGGITLWLLYGTLVNDVALLTANGVTLILLIGLITLKVRTRRRAPGDRLEDTEPVGLRHPRNEVGDTGPAGSGPRRPTCNPV